MPATGTITPVNEFTEPVRAPADGDAGNAETFAAGLQDLANQATWLRHRSSSFRAAITGSAVPSGNLLTLGSGASFGTGADYDLTANEVAVPEPGQYLISVAGKASSSRPESSMNFGFRILVGGSSAVRLDGTRFSTATGDKILISGSYLANITDPATQKITVAAYEGVSGGVTPEDAHLTIVRVG